MLSPSTRSCATCGFLGITTDVGELAIAGSYIRKGLHYDQRTACAVGAANLHDEIQAATNLPDAVLPEERVATGVLWKDRLDCPEFFAFRPRHTPKEHAAMKADLAFRELVMDREDRRDREMRQREDDRDAAVRSRHRWELIVFGGLIGVATLLGSIIQAGWITEPRWFP